MDHTVYTHPVLKTTETSGFSILDRISTFSNGWLLNLFHFIISFHHFQAARSLSASKAGRHLQEFILRGLQGLGNSCSGVSEETHINAQPAIGSNNMSMMQVGGLSMRMAYKKAGFKYEEVDQVSLGLDIDSVAKSMLIRWALECAWCCLCFQSLPGSQFARLRRQHRFQVLCVLSVQVFTVLVRLCALIPR